MVIDFPLEKFAALSLSARRAWIEIQGRHPGGKSNRSLSARRAWIEILLSPSPPRRTPVALRKESVDRNPIAAFLLMWWQRSLSARRAWIEMPVLC